MKRVAFLSIFLIYLFFAQYAGAQGTFRCAQVNFLNCETVLAFCDTANGYSPILTDPTKPTCEDYTVSDCPVGEHTCQKPTPATICTPNQKFCSGRLMQTCDANGTGVIPNFTTNCANTGQYCVNDGAGVRCGSCLEWCRAGGSTTSECLATLCGSAAESPTPIGSLPAGNPDAVLIDLNAVIQSMGGKIPNLTTIGTILSAIIPILFGFSGVALLLYLIAGGFLFLTSGGDPKKMESAKNMITLAVIGFVIIISAYSVTQVAQYVFQLQSPGGLNIF